MATILPAEVWDAEADAKVLRKAMKGFGTDEKALIDIVATRSWKQLKEIEDMFKTAFGRDLKDDIKSELKGNLEQVVLARFLSPDELDAVMLRKAMKGIGTNEQLLVHVICTKTNAEIEAVKESYSHLFERNLVEDVISECTGNLEKLLVALLQAGREEEEELDEKKADDEAQEIFDAGEGAWGTDESVFNRIFVLRSYEQLRATFSSYANLAGKEIEEVIGDEMSGDVKNAFLTLINHIRNPIAFYAKTLHSAMEGVGTSDRILQRIILHRCEVDLQEIKEMYKCLYADVGEGGLHHWLAQDCSGDYQTILQKLCSGPEQ